MKGKEEKQRKKTGKISEMGINKEYEEKRLTVGESSTLISAATKGQSINSQITQAKLKITEA